MDDTTGIKPGAMGKAWRELMDEVWWGPRDDQPDEPDESTPTA